MKRLLLLLLAVATTAATLPLYIDTATNTVVSPDAPTTAAGYGITDAVVSTEDETITGEWTFTQPATFNGGAELNVSTGTTLTLDNMIRFGSNGLVTLTASNPNIAAAITLPAASGKVLIESDIGISDFRVSIFEAADFPALLVDGTQYEIYGAVDMGAVELNFPPAPDRVTFCGIGPRAELFSSEDSYIMFNDGVDSGSIRFDNMRLSVTGTSSKLFDLDNDGTGAFVMTQVTIFNCTEIGTLEGYNFISAFRSQDTLCTDGWTIDGTVSVFDFTQYGSFGMASGGVTFSSGGSLLITSRAFIQGNFTMPMGATFSDIAPANIVLDAGLEVFSCEFEGLGVFFSNITEKSVKSRWEQNNFPSIPPDNTHVGGGWKIADSGDEVINSSSPTVYSKVNGTTTPIDLQWFSEGTANDLTADSTRAINVIIGGTIYFNGTNNQTIQCKLVADDGVSPVDIFELGEIEFVGNAAPLAYPIIGISYVITEPDTVIELHAKTSSGSFTAKVHSNLTILEK